MCTDILVVKINYLHLITIFNVALLFKYYFGFKSFVVLIQELGNIGDRGLGVPGSLTPWLVHDVRVPSKVPSVRVSGEQRLMVRVTKTFDSERQICVRLSSSVAKFNQLNFYSNRMTRLLI